MNRRETALLLSLCSSHDLRTVGEVDVEAWHDVLEDVDFTDAKEAVKLWHREPHDKRIQASDVRLGVRKIRAERIGNRTLEVEVANPDDWQAYLEALRERQREIADGRVTPHPALDCNLEGQQRVQAMIAGTFPSPPDAAAAARAGAARVRAALASRSGGSPS